MESCLNNFNLKRLTKQNKKSKPTILTWGEHLSNVLSESFSELFPRLRPTPKTRYLAPAYLASLPLATSSTNIFCFRHSEKHRHMELKFNSTRSVLWTILPSPWHTLLPLLMSPQWTLCLQTVQHGCHFPLNAVPLTQFPCCVIRV